MIKVKRSFFAAAALGFALVSTGAQAAYSSYWMDVDGNSATNNSVFVDSSSPLGILGSIKVVDTFTSLTNFDFVQTGTVNLFYNDVTPVGKLVVNGFGSGTVNSGFTYSGGTVQFLNTSGTQIGLFNLTGGGSSLFDGLLPGSNNTVRLLATGLGTGFSSGYFFQDAGGLQGQDFATFDDGKPVFAVSTTNLSNAVTKLTPGGAEITGKVGGQFNMEIPEPESLALVGLGLVALVASRRRKAAK